MYTARDCGLEEQHALASVFSRPLLIPPLGNRCKLAWARRGDLSVLAELLLEVLDGVAQPLLHRHPRLPADLALGHRDVRLALLRVVGCRGHVLDRAVGVGRLVDERCKLSDGVLLGVADVDWHVIAAFHESHEAGDEVIDVLEAPRRAPVPVDRDVVPLEGLNDEVRDDAAVGGVHARAKRVEDTRHPHVHPVLLLISVHHGLSHALPLVVARARPNGVHVTPVGLGLGVDLGVAVDLGGGGEEDAGAHALREPQHVQRPLHAGLDRLHGVVLVVRRRGRAREMVDPVHLHQKRLCDVMDVELEIWVSEPVLYISPRSSEKVVNHDHFMSLLHKPIDEVGSHEACASSHHDPLSFRPW
mmetsp:Transcript_14859/g.34940  ORF Transcript_14859/g.34940 Transcript_14859/m.34940 type:complete len:359 (-) Transcript_14859:274-1350(-)